jgi:hypothetical protein
MLDKNQTFEQFILSCAGSIDYMQHEPSDHHQRALAEAQAKVERLAAMDMPDRFEYGHEVREREIKDLKQLIAVRAAEISRCQEMLQRAQAWAPPTEDHEGLKRFMVEQLTRAIGEGNKYYEILLARHEQQKPMAWFEHEIAGARSEVEYHAEQNAQERERTDERSRWIAQLRSSLR